MKKQIETRVRDELLRLFPVDTCCDTCGRAGAAELPGARCGAGFLDSERPGCRGVMRPAAQPRPESEPAAPVLQPLWHIDFFVGEERVRALVWNTVKLAAKDAQTPIAQENGAEALAARVTDALFRMIAAGPTLSRQEAPAEVAARYLRCPPADEVSDPAAPEAVPEAAPPPSDEQRVEAAAAAYRRFRTLSRQAQVTADEMREASATWQVLRDALFSDSPAGGLLQKAMKRVDAELEAARARPALYPHQLPGARPGKT